MGVTLTRRLILEEAVRSPDGAGGFTEIWTPLGVHWAHMNAGAGQMRGDSGPAVAVVGYRIIIRAAPVGALARPRPNQRFREGTRLLTILAVTDDHPQRRYLTCYAEEEVAP